MVKHLFLFTLLWLSFASGATCTSYDYGETVTGEGTILYTTVEGGFYIIRDDKGAKYDPVNLAYDFQQDGCV